MMSTAIPSRDFSAALGIEEPPFLRIATYTLDEGELFNLIHSIALDSSANVKVRLDRGGFRTFGAERLVNPKWFKPISPARNQKNSRRTPPVFHPKLILAKNGHGRWRLIVSTANLARSDQRRSANLLISIDLDSKSATKVCKWLDLGLTKQRTLLLECAADSAPQVIIHSKSTWDLVRKHIEPNANNKWILAAPTWSTKALSLVRINGGGTVEAYCRDRKQVDRVCNAKGLVSLSCHVPASGAFHQKVFAWKGRIRGKTRVLLYIGSANMSASGFFGMETGCKAWNWEAGILFIGESSLWRYARQAARSGIKSWKVVRPKKNTNEDDEDLSIGDEGDEQLDHALRADFGTRLLVRHKPKTIRLKTDGQVPLGYRLKHASVEYGDRSAKLGNSAVKIPTGAKHVEVVGTYVGPRGGRRDIVIQLPELSCTPRDDETGSSVAWLRGLLAASPGTEKPTGSEPKIPNGATTRWTDIRFPMRELLRTYGKNPRTALSWLARVEKNNGAPLFWRELCRRLRSKMSSA